MELHVKNHFSKSFSFRSLPQNIVCAKPFQHLTWKVPELEVLKKRLNTTKNLLSPTNQEKWHYHTTITNPAGAVYPKVKSTINPELLTQAWLKFYECLHQFEIVDSSLLSKNSQSFESYHLCEVPGAFISALNHFLKTNHPELKFSWTATSLNPYYEGNTTNAMIGDDRFLFHTLSHWQFGSDDTGNIMDWNNVESLLSSVQDKVVNLVTADGSINCAKDPGEQEANLAQLHWCETITALSILSNGGSYVLKIFTMFENSTLCLLYVLQLLFEKIHIFKPVTSKEGNSEVYVIALQYKKSPEAREFVDVLKTQVYLRGISLSKCSLFDPGEIPQSFLTDLIDCATRFTNFQEAAILRNLTLYNIPDCAEDTELLKKRIAHFFVRFYCLKTIDPLEKIVQNTCTKFSVLRLPRKLTVTESSSNQRSKEELMNQVNDEQGDIEILRGKFLPICWVNQNKIKWNDCVCYVYGKEYDRIRNTKFCQRRTFEIFCVLEDMYPIKSHPYYDALLPNKQNMLLNCFLEKCDSLSEEENFEFNDFPLLSRFSVATVWTISLLFEKVEISPMNEPKIRFIKFKRETEILTWMYQLDPRLLSFINISHLYGKILARGL